MRTELTSPDVLLVGLAHDAECPPSGPREANLPWYATPGNLFKQKGMAGPSPHHDTNRENSKFSRFEVELQTIVS